VLKSVIFLKGELNPSFMTRITIIDCYTDEPSGFGVPPYLGIFPRYIAGYIKKRIPDAQITYLTVDDLRATDPTYTKVKKGENTDIFVYNRTPNDPIKTLRETQHLYVIVGVQVPGKYLSAVPGTFKEITTLLERHGVFHTVGTKKVHRLERFVFAGPAMSDFGSQVQGGKFAEAATEIIKETMENVHVMPEAFFTNYATLQDFAVLGAPIIYPQFPKPCILEMETSRGCYRTINCSYCTEPLADRQSFREQTDIVGEMKVFYDLGQRHFRFGRQTCFFSYKRHNPAELEKLFLMTWEACPEMKVLHIDNVDPVRVVTKHGIEMVKMTVKYCTPGNIAPMGIETFDADVVRKNDLNSMPNVSLRAIEILNEHGREYGENGMPKFLGGINILFGLIGEGKQTHAENMKAFSQVMGNDWWVRRINIRQVVPFYGTKLYREAKNKFIKKNKASYFRWRKEIRDTVDSVLLSRMFPVGHVIKDCMAEVYKDGVTYFRQLATYPLIIGVKGKFEIKKFYDLRIMNNMKRSLVGEVIALSEDQFFPHAHKLGETERVVKQQSKVAQTGVSTVMEVDFDSDE
jgi:radical SAM superfamily enzyme with C-terminal helix-hairpin-helix motif